MRSIKKIDIEINIKTGSAVFKYDKSDDPIDYNAYKVWYWDEKGCHMVKLTMTNFDVLIAEVGKLHIVDDSGKDIKSLKGGGMLYASPKDYTHYTEKKEGKKTVKVVKDKVEKGKPYLVLPKDESKPINNYTSII